MSFISWDLPSVGSSNNRLNADECSIIVRDKVSYNVMFSNVLSRELKNNGFTHVDIRQDDITQEIAFVFNKGVAGIKFRYTYFGKNAERPYAVISNKVWVTRLLHELQLPANFQNHVKISSNKSRRDDFACYRIIRKDAL